MEYINKSKKLVTQYELLFKNKIIPCTKKEIEILNKSLKLKIPDTLKEFLLWNGKGSSILCEHFELPKYNELLENKNKFSQYIRKHGNINNNIKELGNLIKDTFIIIFFDVFDEYNNEFCLTYIDSKDENTTVYSYDDEVSSFKKISNSFSEWIFNYINKMITHRCSINIESFDKLNFLDIPDDYVLSVGKSFIKREHKEDLFSKEIPERIFDFHNLKSLYFYKMGIENISEKIKNLLFLEKLSLGNNNISSIPKFILNLPNLKFLSIGKNIKTIPKEIYFLSKLESLDLSDNYFEIFPDSVLELKNLKSLSLMSCGLNYIPDTLGDLNNLEYLNLSNNKISVFPESLSNLKKLKELNITNNSIEILPNFVSNLENLETLGIGFYESNIKATNKFNLIDDIKNLSNLNVIRLFNSNISEFPKILLKIKGLRYVDIRGNKLEKSSMEKIINENKNISIVYE